ncbi:SDR family NAD(P)-dependent oxidoreductase [Pseudohalioglobus sediminis]|uniref:SDR family NAD(P)-dependent oxidoreductase n=1 Tax=Pseudohalioglobus sediminis TaxID=2606449 RepID=A0A5B0X438_9GAMM|nr:SDR family NAD(P)-dependent oxidoreductase [Pseudohalioglobus sediminis]KAA1194033.1 SDR family NAD(P)-dependent oxidoreductase [Pseudohalioglobus sediminis]
MTTLSESIQVKRPIGEAFAYVADFTTTTEWDATATSARRLTRGQPGAGSEFLVTCALPLGSLDLHYTITQYDAPHRLVLLGKGRFFDVEDTITFTEGEDGATRIDYRAEFRFKPLLRRLSGAMQAGLERMGRASVAGLKRALDDDFPAPAGMQGDDTTGSPGHVLRFTRFGYQRARNSWHPMSADMRGKHAVITGTSSGLGLASARELARRGATLTLVMRDPKRADAVRRELVEETGNAEISVELADLSLLAQVDALCARLLARGQPIDILINNAGALFNDYARTEEGIERSLALLLLSPYRMTLALQPLLASASGSARVINVVSGGMYTQKLSMKNLEARSAEKFSGAVAYARAKRALMVVTRKWARDWQDDGIVVNAMHPGWADTPGVASSLPAFHSLTRFALRSPEEGADTIVWLAVATEAARVSGQLFMDREAQPLHLKTSTHESASDREQLLAYLKDYDPQPLTAATGTSP